MQNEGFAKEWAELLHEEAMRLVRNTVAQAGETTDDFGALTLQVVQIEECHARVANKLQRGHGTGASDVIHLCKMGV